MIFRKPEFHIQFYNYWINRDEFEEELEKTIWIYFIVLKEHCGSVLKTLLEETFFLPFHVVNLP